MKQINLSDEDYKFLMECVKELNEQDHDGQAHPRFWVPCSTREGIGTEDDEKQIYNNRNCCIEEAEEVFENNPELVESFFEFRFFRLGEDETCEFGELSASEVDDFIDHVGEDPDYDIVYSRKEEKCEVNPSFFKSDVKRFIASNKHHLGENPQTYAHSVWRMPKMERLVNILYSIKHS
jgi:hypothetical protein